METVVLTGKAVHPCVQVWDRPLALCPPSRSYQAVSALQSRSSALAIRCAGDLNGSIGRQGQSAASLLMRTLGEHRLGAQERKTGLRERA